MTRRSTSTERLADVRERLVRWRERHGGPGRPIPPELWEAAAAVAGVEGVDTTARTLGVDRDRLARWVEQGPSTVVARGSLARGACASSTQAEFVELPRIQSSLPGSVVRLVGSDGEQMEIVGSIDVLALAREFWNRGRCSS